MFTAGTIAPRDSASFSENPTFLSTTGSSANFLHIDPTVATRIESGGANIAGITDDFDGDIRQGNPGYVGTGTAPDVGADEYAGTAPDLTPPAISYTALGNTSSIGARTLTATITDASGVPTSGAGLPVLYWKINAGSYTAATATSLGSNQYQFSFGAGAVLGNTVSYYVVAQDSAATPNVSANPSTGAAGFTFDPPAVSTPPTTPNSYAITINGNKTVGSGGDYATLTAAVAALNSAMLGGPLTLFLTDASYPSETFPITINANSGSSAINTVTITPANGAIPTISGSNGTAIISLNGCDFVIIDGDNGGTGNLTLRNTSTAGATIRFINDASNNTVTSTIIEGAVTTATSGVVLFSTGTTTGNLNNTVSLNLIRDRSDAAGVPANLLYSAGTSAAIPNKNNTITTNVLSNFTGNGITMTPSAGNESWTISGNVIFELAARTTALIGISFASQGTNTITQNTIRDLNTSAAVTGMQFGDARATTVSRNRIFNIPSASASTGTLIGINSIGNSGTAANVTVVNNFISIVPSFTNAQIVKGIQDNGFSGNTWTVDFNTVFVGGTGSGTSSSWAILRTTSTPDIYTMRNNIAFNNRTGGTGNRFAAGDQSANTGTLVSNFNFFAGTGATAANFMDYGTSATGTAVSFATWKAGPPARDASSIANTAATYTVSTFFADANNGDLHLTRTAPATPNPAENFGTPLGSVTNDFDDDTRVNPPDIGADEFTGAPSDLTPPTISYTALANTASTGARTLTATITDTSGVPTSGAGLPRLYWKINAGSYTAATATSLGGDQYQFSFGAGAVLGNTVSYYVVAQDSAPALNVSANPSAGASGFTANPPAASTPPTTPNSYTIVPWSSGTFNVGAGQVAPNYTTLTAAIADLNSRTITGPVVFILTASTYPSETFPIVITANSGSSAVNTVTIKPITGGTPTLSSSNTTTIIDLNGCKFVTIDGFNGGTGDLTLRNTSTTSTLPGATVRFINDASNNTVTNTVIEGAVTTATSGVVLFSTGTTTGNLNNTVSLNLISDRNDAAGVPANLLYSAGTSAAIPNKNNTISSNHFKNFTANAITMAASAGNESWTINDNFIYQSAARTTPLIGISFASLGTNTITHNTIGKWSGSAANCLCDPNNTFLTSSAAVTGMQFGDARATTVSRNAIAHIPSTSGSTGTLIGINSIGSSGNPANVTVVNNFISIVPSFPNAQIVKGIQDAGLSGNTFTADFNSVLVGGTASGSSSSWAILRTTSAPDIYTTRNNIALNKRTGGTGNHFAAGDQSANTGTLVSNFNLFAGTGATAANFMDYGTSATGTAVSFATWKAGPPARDANSIANTAATYTGQHFLCRCQQR